jgi:ERCC4-type nuclease
MHTSPHHVVIAVGERELGSPVAALLRTRADVDLRPDSKIAGFVVADRLVADHFTLDRFAGAVHDGWAFRRARRLAADPRAACLILEGEPGYRASRTSNAAGLRGAVVMLSVVFGLPVLRSRSPAESACLLITAGRQLGRFDPAPPRTQGPPPTTPAALRHRMLQAMPDIGPLRAAALLEAFETIAGLARATPRQLAATRGIGPEIADRLWKVVHDPGNR